MTVLGTQVVDTRSAHDVLDDVRTLVEPAHRAVVDRLPAEMRRIAGYHVGWWDAEGRSGSGSGKAVRPALALASASALAGEAMPGILEDAVAAAVAVELVHDFSLLHDDIMDGDLTRRHRPTAWSVFGIGEAILAGDMLLTLAFDVLRTGPARRAITAAVLDLCAGQSADLSFETRAHVR
jgi:geranylgeranyl diphosphate synthase type I